LSSCFFKDKIGKRCAVDLSVRQQNAFAEVRQDLPVSRQAFFNHPAGDAVGVNDDGAGIFEYCGYRGFSGGDSACESDDLHDEPPAGSAFAAIGI